MRLPTVAIFDLGAELYDWFTSQPLWWGSCARLATDLPRQARVLDLGCGPGVSSLVLARQQPEARIIGVDLAWRMARRARQHVLRAGLDGRVTVVRASAACLPCRDASVDAVVGHSFLYLVPERQQVLAECWRVLRPGGRVAFMEPSAAPARPAAILAQSHDPRFLVSVSLWRPFSALHGRFTPGALTRLLRAAGFEDVSTEPVLGGLGIIGRGRKPGPEGGGERR